MANKRINELALRTPQTTDLMLIGDPTTGYSYKTTLLSALNLGVPTTRTITINGTTFDLSANRSWSVGTVTSVGLTMPSAFNVASSPITGSGTIAVTAAGLASQYIRGDGTLADFPGGGGSGGASVSYYLNGSVNQGTLGGVTYYEMNKTPILGAGTNFTTSTNGYIASFLTDAGDPALLKIPGGNWNTEFYFAASSGGGTPTYYIELYKYDGTTFTLIASNSSNPDAITGGTSVEQYFTTLAVPETVLTATDRLAIRIYVTTAGRTITLHTENSNLCQIITTFTTGLTALNGLTAQVQYFATGTNGTDFNINSTTATHTFNIPTASATNRGLLSTADWTTFNNKVPYTGATANVDLGIYNLSAKSVFIEGTASYQSGLAMKQLNSFDFVSGEYTQIAPSSTTELNLVYNQSGGARRRAALSAAVLQNGDNFQYLFPRQNGTFAMLTDISTAINGTTNWIPRFTSANTIGLSNLYDGSSFIGVFTATDNLSGAKLQVNGAATFSGNVGIGVNPSAWGSGFKVLESTSGNSFYATSGASALASNAYNDGTNWIYKTSAGASLFATNQGQALWFTAPSGTAGNAITFTQAMTLTASGNLAINDTTTTSASGYNWIRINGSTGGVLELTSASSRVVQLQSNGTSAGGILQTVTDSPLAFGTNGSEKMRITSSGNVGIGTATPNYLLQVGNATSGYTSVATIASSGAGTSVSNLLLQNVNSSETAGTGVNLNFGGVINWLGRINAQFVGSTGAGNADMTFWTPSGGSLTERMRINSSGNLGIGVTPSAWGGSQQPVIQIGNGGGFIQGRNDGFSQIQLGTNGYFDGTNFRYINSGIATRYYQSNGIHAWEYAPSGTAGNAISFTQAMTLDASGRLGIGQNNPTRKLDVLNSADAHIARFTGGTSSNINIGIYASNALGFGSIGTQSNHGFNIYTNDIDRFSITSSGNVGIGTPTPTNLLNVSGTGYIFNLSGGGTSRIAGSINNTSGNLEYGLEGSAGNQLFTGAAAYTANIGTSNNTSLNFATNTTVKMTITPSGRTLIGTTTDNTVDLLQVAGSLSLTTNLKMTSMTTAATAGSISTYVQISVNGTNYKLALYAI